MQCTGSNQYLRGCGATAQEPDTAAALGRCAEVKLIGALVCERSGAHLPLCRRRFQGYRIGGPSVLQR